MRLFTTVCIMLFLSGFAATMSHAQLARQWVARYSNADNKGLDVSTAMAVDDSGNVYVTGYSALKNNKYALLTMKYSPDGVLLWVASFGCNDTAKSKAIAIDTMDNVYVAAAIDSGGSYNYLTMKYSTGGVLKWAQMYDGPGHGEDQPTAIAVDDSMHVFVTGYSMGVGTGFDYATLKYDTAGNLKWEKRYNGRLGGDDRATGIALYSHTSVYVTGAATDTSLDFVTLKYNAATGDSIWMVQYNGPSNGKDIPTAIIAHSSTDIYVTGSSEGVFTGTDYATMRINSSGVVQWVSRYNGTASGDDNPVALAYGSKIYVTGRSLQIGTFYDMVTVGLNISNGNVDWVSSYNGTANEDDYPTAIYPSGSYFYVLGSSTDAGVGLDYALIKYRGSNGQVQWSVTYNGPGNGDDITSALGYFNGSFYVTGSSLGGKTGQDFLTIKYSDPLHLKYRTFTQDSLVKKGVLLKNNSSVPNIGNVRDMAYDAAFPKIKAGYAGAPGGLVVGIAKKDSARAFGWIRVTKGSAIAAMVPQTNPAGPINSFVGEMKDPKVTKYNNKLAGDLLALKINIGASDAEITPPTFGDLTYNDGDTSNHYNGMTLRQLVAFTDNALTFGKRYPGINYISLDTSIQKINKAFSGPLGIVSVLPQVVVSGYQSIDSVAFLAPGAAPLANPLAFPEGSIAGEEQVPEVYTLYQNYPNPFNPSTTIKFDLPQASEVTLKIYNMIGQEVVTLLDHQEMDGGSQAVTFNASNVASGVYFYRMIANQGEFQTVKKMVLIK
ncbi:MAG: T9SS type A sorting domain-containing protein [Bacteroidota bacterium]